MYSSLPLAASSYTLHVLAARGFGRSQHIAQLVSPQGRVCKEWSLSAPRWQLKRQVGLLCNEIDEMLGGRTAVPVHYGELSSVNGTRKPAVSFAS